MKRSQNIILLTLLALLALAVAAIAAVPSTISYQGYLKNSDGTPVTIATTVRFSLYSSNPARNNPVWRETKNITPANGVYSTQLGSGTPITAPFDVPYRLGVQVGTDPEMPLQPLSSVPYAQRAAAMDAGTQTIQTGSDTSRGLIVRANSATQSANLQEWQTSAGSAVASVNPAGDLTLAGNLNLPTTTATKGIIKSGGQRLIHTYGSDNFFAGINAGNFTATGYHNTGIGSNTLTSNTTGYHNTGLGVASLYYNTSGDSNTGLGYWALYANTTGAQNAGIGSYALYSNTSGAHNTAVGHGGLGNNTTASGNTAVGFSALSNQSFANSNTLWSSNNTAVGKYALHSNQSTSTSNGINNTALGYMAGYTATPANANTTGYNNTFIGANSGPGTSTQLTNVTAIGYNALVSQSNSLVLGGTGIDAVRVGIGTTTPAATLTVANSAAATKGLTVQGAVGQTANLQEWQNNSGAPLAAVSSAGVLNLPANGLAVGSTQLVASGGKVGIGKVPVSDLLDVDGSMRMNNNQIFLRNNGDTLHGVGWYVSNGFATGSNDGPVVYGCGGGTLGSTCGGNKVVLKWDSNGNVTIPGVLSKGSGSFKIDHPLDPRNKYLYHSFVESPDMMNIYNGNITTDSKGFATVELPEWFEALNSEFRYQLTVMGKESWARARVYEEIIGNRFVIQTDIPGTRVSWQVTGIRKDAYAEKNRIPVEENKPATEMGSCLHPEACN